MCKCYAISHRTLECLRNGESVGVLELQMLKARETSLGHGFSGVGPGTELWMKGGGR